MKKVFLLIASVVLLSSCAAVFTGSTKTVTFDSNINQPISLSIDGYKIGKVNMPYTTRIKGGFSETIIKAETEGYEPTLLIINKDFNAVSVINLFNPLGWVIDAATGAMMKPEFKFYEIEFTPTSEKAPTK